MPNNSAQSRSVITTPRLSVRYLNESDYSAFSLLESDPDVRRFVGGPSSVSLADYQRLISTPSKTCMAVCRKSDGRFIGRCGFRDSTDRIELEILLLPDEQGQGFGRELFEAMISYSRAAFPGLKVAATVSPMNSRAINLLTANGFTDSGETVTLKSGSQQSVYLRIS